MKTIIDTLKEIIKKDASTQTEPVTIIENEETIDMIEEIIPSKRAHTGESDDSPKKHNKTLDDTDLYSGKEHVQEKKKIEEEKQIKSDDSFLEKCKNYVLKVYPEEIYSSDFYSGIEGGLRYPIVNNNIGFNVEEFGNLIKNQFSSKAYGDFYDYTDQERKDSLTFETAGIYKVCAEGKEGSVSFTDRDLLKDTIQKYLAEVTNIELAREVFEILDNSD
jgi:hypothetical protein